MTPDVTVIIPAFNSMPYVTQAIESVLEQTLGLDSIEIIAVDDGSTDGTGAEFDRLAEGRVNMTVIHHENSGGPATPRNEGLERASGRYIFFLDADDYLSPKALERMIRCADEHGTDIVLGKMVGVGGRRPPKSMFRTTLPSTDVFESRAWWTMSPMKLYRRELIERLGLRFSEGLLHEDQPFTGAAYLNARAISILSDDDYVFIRWREDNANLTRGHLPPDRLTEIIGVMVSLIVSSVPKGPRRDHLLKRHYEMELFEAFASMAESTDSETVRASFSRLREWAIAYFPYEVVRNLSPAHRITHSLLLQGRLDLLLDFMNHYSENPEWTVFVQDDRVYAVYPYFRDVEANVPAECFDVTSRVRLEHELTDVSWHEGMLHLEGLAYLELLDTSQTETELVLRERSSGAEHVLPVARVATPGHPTEVWRKPFTHDFAGISVDADPLTAADGGPLPTGVWDVRLRVSSQGITKDVRIGEDRAADIDDGLRWRVLPADSPNALIVSSYFTAVFGNLSLDVGAVNHPIKRWFACESVVWSNAEMGVLEIGGATDVVGLGAATLRVVVTDEAGNEFSSPASVDGDRFVARIALRSAAGGRPLSRGRWMVTVRARVGDLGMESAPAPKKQLGSVRFWRALWPYRARVTKPGQPLALEVARTNVIRALANRLTGVQKR